MLLDYFKLVILLSIPQALIHIWLTFELWGLKPMLHYRKLILYAVVNSLIVDLDIWSVTMPVHMLTSTCLNFIVMFFVFRSFGNRKMLIVFLSNLALLLLVELLCTPLLQLVYGPSARDLMIDYYLLQRLSGYAAVGFIFFCISRYLEKRNFIFFHRLYQYLASIKQTRGREILLLTLFQAFLLGILFYIGLEQKQRYTEMTYNILIYALVVLTFGAFFFTIRLLVNIREEAVRKTQDIYVEELGKMFTSIRGQRHDFLNHVQVMSSMLRMNKIDRLRSYMEDIVKEAQIDSEIISHPTPALAAFIQAKKEMAITRNIDFTYEIPNSLDIESSIKSIDLVKIMGNLVDNAFDESDMLPMEQRLVHLSIRLSDGMLEIEVRNQGRLLSEQDKSMIILPGYTTKKSGHSGLGLAIVHERVQFYKGLLDIESWEEKGTSILVTLPQR
ncbi:sensor histidine kinase [Cohnella cholangitidis]|nr:ATP-binding protein [Cohnella cholangitidis]